MSEFDQFVLLPFMSQNNRLVVRTSAFYFRFRLPDCIDAFVKGESRRPPRALPTNFHHSPPTPLDTKWKRFLATCYLKRSELVRESDEERMRIVASSAVFGCLEICATTLMHGALKIAAADHGAISCRPCVHIK